MCFYKHIPAVMEHLPPLKLTLLSYIQTHSGSARQRGLLQWSHICIVWWSTVDAYHVFNPALHLTFSHTVSLHAQDILKVKVQCDHNWPPVIYVCTLICVWETTAATSNSSMLPYLTVTMSSQPQMSCPRATHSPFTQHLMHIAYKNELSGARLSFQENKGDIYSLRALFHSMTTYVKRQNWQKSTTWAP